MSTIDTIEAAAKTALEALEAHHRLSRDAVRVACDLDLGPMPNYDVQVWVIARALSDAGQLNDTKEN